jgi:hypothetical protein
MPQHQRLSPMTSVAQENNSAPSLIREGNKAVIHMQHLSRKRHSYTGTFVLSQCTPRMHRATKIYTISQKTPLTTTTHILRCSKPSMWIYVNITGSFKIPQEPAWLNIAKRCPCHYPNSYDMQSSYLTYSTQQQIDQSDDQSILVSLMAKKISALQYVKRQ